MRAIILAAGQGTRLLPFTRDNPKCLVPVEGRAILDHQLDALHAAGVSEVLVVGGYRLDRLKDHLTAMPAASRPRLLCNPFWAVSNSIGSVWTARAMLDQPFCLLNGDTILAPELIRQAIEAARPGVSLMVEQARLFAHDDMRVDVAEGVVRAVGKDLTEAAAQHRSLGVIVATGAGPHDYATALEAVVCAEGGAQRFHHAVVAHLATTSPVHAIVTASPLWIEIDRPEDIERWRRR